MKIVNEKGSHIQILKLLSSLERYSHNNSVISDIAIYNLHISLSTTSVSYKSTTPVQALVSHVQAIAVAK